MQLADQASLVCACQVSSKLLEFLAHTTIVGASHTTITTSLQWHHNTRPQVSRRMSTTSTMSSMASEEVCKVGLQSAHSMVENRAYCLSILHVVSNGTSEYDCALSMSVSFMALIRTTAPRSEECNESQQTFCASNSSLAIAYMVHQPL